MTTEEWQCYVNTGEVPLHFIKSMVKLIREGKVLSQQHIAVYTSHARIIETLLKKDI
jgi:surface polysaccharide O-acyltransferase-like enzyme